MMGYLEGGHLREAGGGHHRRYCGVDEDLHDHGRGRHLGEGLGLGGHDRSDQGDVANVDGHLRLHPCSLCLQSLGGISGVASRGKKKHRITSIQVLLREATDHAVLCSHSALIQFAALL